jgi:4'-phosphopantetheinyl transferase
MALWHLSTPPHPLDVGEVHLWRALCGQRAIEADALLPQLTEGEVLRAARMATDTLRRRYLYAHTLLHTLLAMYVDAGDVPCTLGAEANGKPILLAPQLHPPLHFNMSHAGEVVLIAVMRGMAVGVDVEEVRHHNDLAGLIRTVCSRGEQAHLAALEDVARRRAFYQLWTRKEAWLKLRGVGLAGGLASTEVLHERAEVQLCDLPLTHFAEGYVGALALPPSPTPTQVVICDAFVLDV